MRLKDSLAKYHAIMCALIMWIHIVAVCFFNFPIVYLLLGVIISTATLIPLCIGLIIENKRWNDGMCKNGQKWIVLKRGNNYRISTQFTNQSYVLFFLEPKEKL